MQPGYRCVNVIYIDIQADLQSQKRPGIPSFVSARSFRLNCAIGDTARRIMDAHEDITMATKFEDSNGDGQIQIPETPVTPDVPTPTTEYRRSVEDMAQIVRTSDNNFKHKYGGVVWKHLTVLRKAKNS